MHTETTRSSGYWLGTLGQCYWFCACNWIARREYFLVPRGQARHACPPAGHVKCHLRTRRFAITTHTYIHKEAEAGRLVASKGGLQPTRAARAHVSVSVMFPAPASRR
jgi:hypothetical protein